MFGSVKSNLSQESQKKVEANKSFDLDDFTQKITGEKRSLEQVPQIPQEQEKGKKEEINFSMFGSAKSQSK